MKSKTGADPTIGIEWHDLVAEFGPGRRAQRAEHDPGAAVNADFPFGNSVRFRRQNLQNPDQDGQTKHLGPRDMRVRSVRKCSPLSHKVERYDVDANTHLLVSVFRDP